MNEQEEATLALLDVLREADPAQHATVIASYADTVAAERDCVANSTTLHPRRWPDAAQLFWLLNDAFLTTESLAGTVEQWARIVSHLVMIPFAAPWRLRADQEEVRYFALHFGECTTPVPEPYTWEGLDAFFETLLTGSAAPHPSPTYLAAFRAQCVRLRMGQPNHRYPLVSGIVIRITMKESGL